MLFKPYLKNSSALVHFFTITVWVQLNIDPEYFAADGVDMLRTNWGQASPSFNDLACKYIYPPFIAFSSTRSNDWCCEPCKRIFYVPNEDNQLLHWSHALKSNFSPYKKKGQTSALDHHGITSLLTSTLVEFEFGGSMFVVSYWKCKNAWRIVLFLYIAVKVKH